MAKELPARDKPLVLVTDDDLTVRLSLRRYLEEDGYTVAEARNGAEALAIFEQQRPDLVLMDAEMPVMDGLTACAAIKKLPGGEETPVLMITGLEDER